MTTMTPLLSALLLWGACTGPAAAPGPVLSIATPLPPALHAGSVEIQELIWPSPAGFSPPELESWCTWRRTGASPEAIHALLAAGRAQVAVLEVPSSGQTLLGGRIFSPEVLASSRAAWALADAGCLSLQGGMGIAREAEIGLAFSPDLPLSTLISTLRSVSEAEVYRLNILVAGPAGEPLPGRVEEDGLRLSASLQEISREGRTAMIPADAAAPLPVAAVLDAPERLGCALLGVSPQDTWGRTTAVLDRLAGVGARRAVLALEDGAASAAAAGVGVGAMVAPLRLEGTAAALLVDVPRLRLEPDGGHPHEGECAPDRYVQRQVRPATEAVQGVLESLEALGGLEALGSP